MTKTQNTSSTQSEHPKGMFGQDFKPLYPTLKRGGFYGLSNNMRKYSLIFSLLFILMFQTVVQAQSPTPTTPPTPTSTPIPNTISGYLYNDLNLNKQWDKDTEPGLSSVPISIEGPTNLSSASASDGYYIFMNLTQGTYTIVPDFNALGFAASSPPTLTVVIDTQGVQNILFGGRPAAPTPTPTATPTLTPSATPTAVPTDTPPPTATYTPEPAPTAAPTATPGNACSLNVDPYQDQAGATFTFVGAGFSSDSSVALGLALPDGSVEGLPAQQANSAGSIGFSYTTQSGDQVGLYTMIAEGSGDDKTCRTSAAFYVDDAPPPTAVKVVVQPDLQTPTPALTVAPTPTATPMPLLTNSSDPLLFGVDLAPLDESVLVIKQGKADPDPDAEGTPDGDSLPGIGGGQGFELQIYPYESLEPQAQLAIKKEATISVWTLLIGLSVLLLTGSLVLLRKRLKPVGIITGVVLISLMMSALLLAQDNLGTAGKGKSRIEGFVINADTDSPPAGGESIKILVNGWLPIQSGTDGEWNITDLGAGNYTIELIELPAGINPKQPVQTVYVNGLESDVQHLNLEYYTGPAVTALPTTEAITDTRVAALGADPTATPLADINTTETLTATGSSTDTAQLPGISGGGRLPKALPTPKVDYANIIAWSLVGLTLVIMGAWVYLSEQRKDGEI